jgi:hypothetical protein
MIIRELRQTDIEKIREIHARHFTHEFKFDEFEKNFLSYFVTENDEGIISAGGVRTIVESVIVTDLDRNVRDRKLALCNVLQASMHVAKISGYDQLHCFIQDKKWQHHLEKVGFRTTTGQSLVLDLG